MFLFVDYSTDMFCRPQFLAVCIGLVVFFNECRLCDNLFGRTLHI